ncbi:hypothetical protein BDV38DRAFT_146073 [Aspergillus pseudotamarii]|uniref:Uncharacterized protein n=1 Tax=Aspergillus pseudotamarii TaxID=132259 RepID=A0A5N6SJV1_ASPPS|nr:uncharacterized protein BDV38DRAFT_146073 [Aspergillus pseudotamarii]KAE8134972.1 hypothetical protein BDV38DRAFT_146073 [Aspergillus pseudotamarii]
MAPEVASAPISTPRSRPRAATAMQPATTPPAISSRRPSQVMSPPALPLAPVAYTGSSGPGGNDQGSVRSASGPLRHPKPLTPSDIHSMLEQEQEAMVNRLSRELSLLRQQTASVASTTSSTSTTFNDQSDALQASSYLSSSTHPTASRRHRSSSSLSSSYIPAVQGSRIGSGAGIIPSRDVPLSSSRPGRSREPSFTSPRQSEGTLPLSPASAQQSQSDPFSNYVSGSHPYPHRNSLSQQRSRTTSISRPDEITRQRGELEILKRENEGLRRRVRDLELVLRKHRERDPIVTDQVASGTIAAITDELNKASVTKVDDTN